MAPADGSQAKATDYLAVERTFLAWIRTGIALMGLGFVLARFGLFLQEFNFNQPNVKSAHYGLSIWFGTTLIFVGVFAAVFSMIRYLRLMDHLRKGQDSFSHASALGIVVAVVLAVLGLAMSFYLIFTRPTPQTSNPQNQENSMLSNPENGIVRLESHHSAEDTVTRLKGILESEGREAVYGGGPQRRGGKGGADDAAYQAADFWQSKGGDSVDAGFPERSTGSAAENSGGRRCWRKNMDFV